MRYILVNTQTNIIENIIELDPRSLNYSGPVNPEFTAWEVPAGYQAIQSDTGAIGTIYSTSSV